MDRLRQSQLLTFLMAVVLASNLSGSQGRIYGFNDPVQEAQRLHEAKEKEKQAEKLQDFWSDRQPFESQLYLANNWEPESSTIVEEESWPQGEWVKELGQVSGVATCPQGNVHIFERGPVVWELDSFDANNVYKQTAKGPIANDTVRIVDPVNGKLLKSWGKNRFYMPHGITIDAEGNVWLTDVALHQVFRFKRDNFEEPELVLGEALVPGNDEKHFCKPTDVAVASSGIVFISDGYCNSRILVISPKGETMAQIGVTDNLVVPHSLTLLEKEDLICVADRENRRIMCYTAGLTGNSAGKLVFNIQHSQLGRVFAIDHIGDFILAINGPDDENPHPVGVSLDLATERMLSSFAPKAGFFDPHDIAVSPDGTSFFVSEIGLQAPKKVYKFRTSIANY